MIELVAGIPLSTLIFAALILAMLHFIKTYQETRLFLQLQDDLFRAVEYMRYGYPHENQTGDERLIGLLSAKDVYLSANGDYIEITPLVPDESMESNYWTRFSVNDDDQLEVRSKYGNSKYIDPIVIFPFTRFTDTERVADIVKFGNEPQFKILNPRDIWTVEKTDTAGNPLLINIRLEAQVRYRAKESGQSEREDIAKNTRSIIYETSVFLGNVD
ncbi:MAG TPA: hypothetical protein PLD62_04885 [Candidatus Cloacimonadota bacterium]|nr:hypothetical protein [Candidatus Cloacimonadota bacterium]